MSGDHSLLDAEQVEGLRDQRGERWTVTTRANHIRRFLLHVLPKGFHRIRHYGLLAGGDRKLRLDHVRQLLGAATTPAADIIAEPPDTRPP